MSASKGPPARLVGGTSDTVIINHRRAVRIPVTVTDKAGQILADSGVGYRWTSGANISVSPNGDVTCAHTADASVEASLGSLHTTMLVLCRPVKKIYIAGPMQFLLPDTARKMEIRAFDLDGEDIDLFSGTSSILDTAVAMINGITIVPKTPGATVAGVRFGNESAGVGIHVYETVSTLAVLRSGKLMVGIPLNLSSAQSQTWYVPAGTWMFTMLPESDAESGLKLRIAGAACTPSMLTKRRYTCLVKGEAAVTVYNPSTSRSAPVATGHLLVRHVNR